MKNPISLLFLSIILSFHISASSQSNRQRIREMGIVVGTQETGKMNSITDVEGVLVGHKTIIKGDHIRTGVTCILPHSGNIFQEKVPAAIFVYNGFGKLAGYTQVSELGNMETPIILTNTLCVPKAADALIRYTLDQPGNEQVRSCNPVVGETNDGYLNDIRGMHIENEDVYSAIRNAEAGPVSEGSVGAGTGTSALGFKGGIGTSSRVMPSIDGTKYTVGVLVQSNFGRELVLNGVKIPRRNNPEENKKEEEGSCMIVIATDAPLSCRNLERLAERAFTGMGRTTTHMSNASGDYAIAFTTAYTIPHQREFSTIENPPLLGNSAMTLLFQAAEEATQEAIYNSLFMATTITGNNGHTMHEIDLDRIRKLFNIK